MTDAPKKNSKLLLVGLVVVVIIVIIAIVGGFVLMGGACCLGSMIFSSNDPTPVDPEAGTTILYDEIATVSEGEYAFFKVSAEPGQLIEARITTDGSPVDVMIMDSEQFAGYKDALAGLNDGTWHTIDTVTEVVSDSVSYTADDYDTYYLVFDNTENPANGAEAGKDVNVNIVITRTSVV